ncbi:hypothetical protein V6Z12_A06G080300 [Gossypium hirsutum]
MSYARKIGKTFFKTKEVILPVFVKAFPLGIHFPPKKRRKIWKTISEKSNPTIKRTLRIKMQRKQRKIPGKSNNQKNKKNLDHFSICACHPFAGAMLIFSVSFQFYQMSPKGEANSAAAFI